MEKFFRAIALLAMVWFQLAAFSAEAEEDAKAQPLPRFSDYRLVDSELKLVGIDSDATESFWRCNSTARGDCSPVAARRFLFMSRPGMDCISRASFCIAFPKIPGFTELRFAAPISMSPLTRRFMCLRARS